LAGFRRATTGCPDIRRGNGHECLALKRQLDLRPQSQVQRKPCGATEGGVRSGYAFVWHGRVAAGADMKDAGSNPASHGHASKEPPAVLKLRTEGTLMKFRPVAAIVDARCGAKARGDDAHQPFLIEQKADRERRIEHAAFLVQGEFVRQLRVRAVSALRRAPGRVRQEGHESTPMRHLQIRRYQPLWTRFGEGKMTFEASMLLHARQARQGDTLPRGG
jgi:hypothetical protein